MEVRLLNFLRSYFARQHPGHPAFSHVASRFACPGESLSSGGADLQPWRQSPVPSVLAQFVAADRNGNGRAGRAVPRLGDLQRFSVVNVVHPYLSRYYSLSHTLMKIPMGMGWMTIPHIYHLMALGHGTSYPLPL